MWSWNHLVRWAGGFLIGTAGLEMLKSHDARKVYAWLMAFGLRGKDYVLDCANEVQEIAEDAYYEAVALNEKYAAEDAKVIEDRASRSAKKATAKTAKKAKA